MALVLIRSSSSLHFPNSSSYNILIYLKLNRSTHLLICLSGARKIRAAYLYYSRRMAPRQRCREYLRELGDGDGRWLELGHLSTGKPQTDKDGFFRLYSAGDHESTIKDVILFRAGWESSLSCSIPGAHPSIDKPIWRRRSSQSLPRAANREQIPREKFGSGN
jgi:hypothetical protein